MDHEQPIDRTSFLETFSEAVILLDMTATILSTNQRARAIVGTGKHDFSPGHTLWQVAPQLVIPFYQAVVNTTRTHTSCQVRYYSPVTQTWLCVYLSPISEGIALFFHEETEPPLFEHSFRQREKEIPGLLKNSSEWVVIMTPEGLLLEINQRPLFDAQVQREDVIGTPFIQIPLWSSAPLAQEQLRVAIARAQQGDTVRFEVRIFPQVGRPQDLTLTLTPRYNGKQQIEYLICTGWDITERVQAEEEGRSLIEVIPNFVWMAGPDGQITYCNSRLIDYLALPLQLVIGDNWIACVHPHDRQRVWDRWRASVHTGMLYEEEYRIQDGTSGTYRWFLVRGVPFKADQGEILFWIGTFTDIDKQKHAEEQIEASEQSFRVLAEMMPQLVITTLPDGRVDYINQRYHDLTQEHIERVGDDKWCQNLHPEDVERVLAQLQLSLRTGESFECEYRRRDAWTGEYRWFLGRALPIRDEAGQIIKWFGTGTDIDVQKRKEEALSQSQGRVQTLMASNVIGTAITEKEQIIDANDTFLNMTGYSREDLQSGRLNWMNMTAPEYVEITRLAHEQMTLNDYMVPYEKEYIRKDGGRVAVVVGGVMTHFDRLQSICFVLDNSARRELEQRKDALLSMASHELKTPITSLKLQTQMLRRQLARQDLHKADTALSRMEGQLNAVTRLVEELFDLSNIQAGKLKYAQEVVNLNEILQETVEVMQQTQITHTIVVHGSAYPLLMVGDKDRLGQVFLNLIGNAIKYSPDANQVEVSMTASSEAVMISVSDEGIGIPQEQRKKIFERFYRAVPVHQRAFPGLGIGLSIVLEIVNHYGGSIIVESNVGKGSTFQVTLPRTGL